MPEPPIASIRSSITTIYIPTVPTTTTGKLLPSTSPDPSDAASVASSAASSKKKPTKKKKRAGSAVTINTTLCKYEIVRKCSRNFGLKVVDDSEPWSVFWIDTGVSVQRILDMEPYQKINHFPGMHEICRKDHLARNLSRLSRLFPKDYNFYPRTWILPLEWEDLKVVLKSKKRQTFIAKPDSGCQGKGIFLFRSMKAIEPMHQNNIIVQTYLNRPYLIDQFKFDLRVYVLVLSADPLRIFIHKEGLVRFATHKYSDPSESNLEDVCMHLTNYAINKKSESFDYSEGEDRGSKRAIKSVFRMLEEKGVIRSEDLWAKISDVVVKTLLTIQPQLSMALKACFPSKPFVTPSDPTGSASSEPNKKAGISYAADAVSSQCFEILGFDIFLDNKLKPWVLEVNHSPSFTCDSPLDTEVKQAVIQDAFGLLNLNACTRKKYEKAERERVRQRLMRGRANVGVGKDSKESKELSPAGASSLSHVRSPDLRDARDEDSDSEDSDSNDPSPAPVNHLYYPEKSVVPNDSNIASKPSKGDLMSTPTRISTSSSTKSTVTSFEDLPEAAQELVKQYYSSYPPGFLDAHKAYEDSHLGSYFRVFPPENPARLAKYIKFLNGSSKLFADTASTKGRQEYLRKKKELEDLRVKKMEQWKKKLKDLNDTDEVKSKLMTWRDKSCPDTELIERRLYTVPVRPQPQPLHMGMSSLSINENLERALSEASIPQVPTPEMKGRFFKSRGGSQQGQSQYHSSGKQTLKLHVESMNDRFLQTFPVSASLSAHMSPHHKSTAFLSAHSAPLGFGSKPSLTSRGIARRLSMDARHFGSQGHRHRSQQSVNEKRKSESIGHQLSTVGRVSLSNNFGPWDSVRG
ncbi:Tubulin polyglutamylase ttll6 [Chytridiales sp. JEL 0842]|nr:Tubulin polyglutamylase ttll6 [Chytridiales sp. JEL 0842]